MACLTMHPRYHHHARPISYFPRPAFPFAEVEALFAPLFEGAGAGAPARARSNGLPARTFQPRFDVKETPEAFHLQGELPGLSAGDVDIQFADHNTLTIHGRVVRESECGDRALADGNAEKAAATEDQAATAAAEHGGEANEKASLHQATVEDEEGEQASAAASTAAPATPATTVAEAKPEPEKAPRSKYWVSERSVGEFHRTFNFPGLVDHAAVKASLKDGILNLEVPKVKRQEPRKITIE